jgi:hypothetical protein
MSDKKIKDNIKSPVLKIEISTGLTYILSFVKTKRD